MSQYDSNVGSFSSGIVLAFEPRQLRYALGGKMSCERAPDPRLARLRQAEEGSQAEFPNEISIRWRATLDEDENYVYAIAL